MKKDASFSSVTSQPQYAPSPAATFEVPKNRPGINSMTSHEQHSKSLQKAHKRSVPFKSSGLSPSSYELMEDKDSLINSATGSAKRHKEESFDSQETNETSSREVPIALLECTENLGVQEPIVAPADIADEVKKESDVDQYNDSTEVFGIETLNYLISREQSYAPDPYYIERLQPDITWTMRLILIDWMMEVCMEFQLKRETFHYSVNFVDRFLSLFPRVSKAELQLVGVTALYVAAKMEEICVPKIHDFAKSTDNGYTFDQIRKMELLLTKTLGWGLAPPTLNMWANWYMGQWDSFIMSSEYAKSHVLMKSLSDPIVVFKQPNEKAYSRFRELSQLIDIIILDIATLRYHPRAIIASLLYTLLIFHYGQATIEEIVTEFPKCSSFLNAQYPFNDLYENFLHASFGFDLLELLPTIQYVSGFLALPFNYALPQIRKRDPENEVIFYSITFHNIGI